MKQYITQVCQCGIYFNKNDLKMLLYKNMLNNFTKQMENKKFGLGTSEFPLNFLQPRWFCWCLGALVMMDLQKEVLFAVLNVLLRSVVVKNEQSWKAKALDLLVYQHQYLHLLSHELWMEEQDSRCNQLITSITINAFSKEPQQRKPAWTTLDEHRRKPMDETSFAVWWGRRWLM